MSTSNKNRLTELDALRGIAALFVVFFHFTIFRPEANYGFRFGVTGVDLFFIISGFVIFLTLSKTKTWQDFALSRLSRLYPVYWACVLLTTALIFASGLFAGNLPPGHSDKIIPPGPWTIATNLTMLPYYFGVENIDGPYWTLLVEMLFYFLMTGIFLFKKLDKIEIIGGIILLLLSVYSVVLKPVSPFLYKIISYGIPLANYFPLFLAGIVFYKIKFEKLNSYRVILILGCFLVQVSLFDDGVRSYGYISQLEYALMLSLYFAIFILYVSDRLKFIVNRTTVFLGKISYPLYLIHQFVSVGIIIPFFNGTLGINFWISSLLIALPIVILLASLLNSFVEIPAMNAIRNLYKRKTLTHNYEEPYQVGLSHQTSKTGS